VVSFNVLVINVFSFLCDNICMPEMFIETLIFYSRSIIPWLVFGSVAAYIVERRFSADAVYKYFGVMTVRKLFFLQALGMVSPLSIMSQLPVAGSLVRLGAHPGLLLSFFVAERAYDFQSFPIIAGLFGIKIAFLNAIAIFLSLSVAAFATRNLPLTIKSSASIDGESFWMRQGKIFGVVMTGIFIGAALRTFIPAEEFRSFSSNYVGGIVISLVVGIILYFGTILGNYPIAKAFADLGMSSAGIFAFLTVSPVLNLVVAFLFASIVPIRYVVRQFGIYAIVALILTIFISTAL